MSDKFVLPQPETGVAIAFLQSLFTSRWDLAAIPPDGGRAEFRTFHANDVSEATDWINERQGISGLYYHINEIHGKRCFDHTLLG